MIVIVTTLLYIIIGVVFSFGIETNEMYSIVGIVVISTSMLFYIFQSLPKRIGTAVFIGLLLRLLLLLVDYYNIFPVLHSGRDSETFFRYASANINVVNKFSYENYVLFLSYLFELIGPQRLFAQFLNVLFGTATIIYVYKTVSLLKLSCRVKLWSTYAIALFPHMIIFSSILLRESLLTCLATISFYYIVRWVVSNNILFALLSILSISGATYFHSGMIGQFLGIIVFLILFNHRTLSLKVTPKNIILLVVAIAFIIPLILTSSYFTGYFRSIFDPNQATYSNELILERINSEAEAGSAYLTNIQMNSLQSVVLYAPIKFVYFLLSPMPWDWRGFGDITLFFLDSLGYLALFILVLKNLIHSVGLRKSSRNLLFYGLLLSIFIYSFGTIAAGTAARHRSKFFPTLVIVAATAARPKRDFDKSLSIY